MKSYGPITLQLAKPVIDPVGESRPNAEVFADLIRLLNLEREGDPGGELEAMLEVLETSRRHTATSLRDHWKATAPFGVGRCNLSM